MRKIISLICFLLPVMAFAGQPETPAQLRRDAPDQHIVVKGDTLWDISAMFFKDPWRWPYIWGMNKDSIKDPHWIYPGDVIILDRATGTLSKGGRSNGVVKLSPQVRSGEGRQNAIPSIPPGAIEPFLSQPLVVADDALAGAPTLVGLHESRVIAGLGDLGYAKGLSEDRGTKWQVYRPGKTFVDPDTKEVLGHEAIYLGDVSVNEFADVSTVVITNANQEINVGDRLMAPNDPVARNYLPRAPESNLSARVISIYGGVSLGGQNTVITLNKGERDGLQNGHVLALYSKGDVVKYEGQKLAMPDERYGLLFVFRVFDKVSYALVMQTHLPVHLLDRAQTP
ncbi:MAG: peptidoglycan-binding protein [Gallionellaceae bacterium CG1_02_56_997]|nr:MAG: peptidoglycan-binding protein [Gallionellaceae bacterium CG1_02_56_997]PIV15410.1 MAG: peptidoglycan-binding protein [Gallionellales bacterium CG03_land_8_20_14_0_80_55_15]HCJ50540.1 peptidoglycan-binding protein [Gallionella sp.]